MRSRTRGLLFIAVILISVTGCASSSTRSDDLNARTIRAESFELTDNAGNVRAALEIDDGSPRFALIDADDSSRLEIRLDEAGNPVLSLFDNNGARRIGFEFANGENPALFLRDESGRLKAGLQVQSDGAPLLFLRNSSLEDGFAVTLIDQDLPVMALSDPQGNRRAFLGLEEAGYSGSLVFVESDGRVESIVP